MMSNEEEKRCPLCAEEMDWTDQQFMPCKCGYQICVWCWNHIIDMAEKDQTEGRCPACRSIYEKEKIIAMQANCERTTTKISSKKSKPPKAKPKANEVKKDLTNIRVIQRKMAYVIGLPLTLADEDVLQRKEYFGQYGKVTKVALSRTAGGAIQQFTNDTCSLMNSKQTWGILFLSLVLKWFVGGSIWPLVFLDLDTQLRLVLDRRIFNSTGEVINFAHIYITYSKEEEALRCIQSVHGFVLEGRFLRASFGTAKYCHAWLKNMPCNNPACLYLHIIGSENDSFGKDEVAAVQTRSRVQQIVGAANSAVKRSGNMLPPPSGDFYNSSSIFMDKATIRSGISDAAHGSANGTGDTSILLSSKEKEGANAVANKMTTFVDIVGRSNCAALEKDRNIIEDRRISNLSSEPPSVTSNGDRQAGEPYSFPTMSKTPCSNHIGNGLVPTFLSDDQGSTDSQNRAFFAHPSYPAIVLEDSSGPALLHKRSHNANGFTVDHDPVPIRCVNSVLTDPCQEMKVQNSAKSDRIYNDSCQEMKFQNSAKSDRIYRSSNLFSNEEIVEHLRRIDDGDQSNDKENSILDAVESSIISNIMSIGLDSCEDSLTMTKGLSDFLDETDGLGGSSWSSLNSDQSGYSFVKQESFANHMAGSILPEYGNIKEQYLCKPQYPVSRSQSLAPPGFSVPSRDPPPGFSTTGRTGTGLSNCSPFPNTFLQPSRLNSSTDDTNFFDPSLHCNKGDQPNGFRSLGFETRPTSNPRLNGYEDDSRLWLYMQQSANTHQDSRFSQMFGAQNPPAQQELSYKAHMGNGLSGLDNMYVLSPRLINEHQNYNQSFFTQISQQTYANGHIPNINGYKHNSVDEVQRNKGELGMTERSERLGVDYFPGYNGDLMFNSSDVYARVFGL
ncbi:hypothetical protein OROGR_009178 [Orobanche gracilis]